MRALILIVGLSLATLVNAEDRSVSVTGAGTVQAAPDVAYVTLGVTTQDLDAGKALVGNNLRMKELFATVKSHGLVDKEIQTSNFALSPRTKYDREKDAEVFLGYTCTNTVTLTVCKLEDVGKIIGSAVEKGGNSIQNVQFAIKDRGALQQKARLMAISDAKTKAEVLVTNGGAALGKLRHISESAYNAPSLREYSAMRAPGGGGFDSPISGGELSVTVTVSATFDIE